MVDGRLVLGCPDLASWFIYLSQIVAVYDKQLIVHLKNGILLELGMLRFGWVVGMSSCCIDFRFQFPAEHFDC